MRALLPRTQAFAVNPIDRVRIFYEVFGPSDAERSLVFLPTWSIVHSRIWKAQVPYFARHGFNVVTFDGRGNGRSGRPATGYRTDDYARDALAVLDAVGIKSAALIGMSQGARWGMQLAAECPERCTHLVLVGPGVQLSDVAQTFIDLVAFHAEPPDTDGWNKFNAVHWRRNYRDFAEFFMAQVTNDAHSSKQIEDAVAWRWRQRPTY